jgi:very-short-patch-repair endonuclease
MSERWNEMSLEQRTQRVEKAKKYWDSLTIEQRENLKRSALQGIRKASKNGSKLENFLVEELTGNGYSVEFHKENLIPNEKMQIDIFLPKENIIIEIDGPTHFYPIWGEESLKKHLSADAEKNGLLLQKGFNVIRVKCISKHISQSKQRTLSSNLINLIKQIKSLTKSSLYEVEI